MVTINITSTAANISQQASLTQNGHACERQGYPIFLLRKSAIKKVWSPSLFSHSVDVPSLGDREPAEKPQDHDYVLRTLREGYVYVLSGKSEKQKDYISCYQVVQDGILKVNRPDDLEIDKPEPLAESCVISNHFVPASFMTVEISDKILQQTPYLWIAYSRYPWNKETRDHYKHSSQLERFTKIDLSAFSQSPENQNRGVGLLNLPLSPVFEFMPNLSSKLTYLPNYKNRQGQWLQYLSFINNHTAKTGKKVGGIVLEDHLGLLEDLNFQRNVESNYTGNKLLDGEKDKNSELYPYNFDPLFSEEYIHKKAIAELIPKYKENLKKQFEQTSVAGEIFVSSIENTWNYLTGKRTEYEHTDGSIDLTGNIRYQLTQSGKAKYDFDNYWAKLESQLKKGELEEFIQKYDQRFKVLEEEIKNNPRDYVLNLRWFLGKQIENSIYLSGKTQTVESLDGKKIDVIYPEQKISQYNQVKFWEKEIDYSDPSNHSKVLLDLSYILLGEKDNLYILGVWQEMLSDKTSLLYTAIAGNETQFWTENNTHNIIDKVFSYLTDNESQRLELIASMLLTNMGDALGQMLKYTPNFSTKIGNDIFQATGLRTILARENIQFSEVTVYINKPDVSKVTTNTTSGYVVRPTVVENKVMLKFFVKGNGDQTKALSDYLNRVNDRNVNPNSLNGRLTNLTRVGTRDFYFNASEARLNALKSEMNARYNIGIDAFTIESTTDGVHRVKFTALVDDNESRLSSMDSYLKRASTGTKQPTVQSFSRVLQDNQIEIVVDQSNIESEASRIIDQINLKNHEWMQKNIQTGVHITKYSALTVINAFSLVWEYQAAQDNIKELDKVSLDKESTMKLRTDIILGYSSSALMVVKTYGDLVKGFGEGINNVLPKMASITEKLGIQAVNRLVLANLKFVNSALSVIGFVNGVKDIVFSVISINNGYRVSGLWGAASAVFGIAASVTWVGGPVGLAITLVLVALSILCALLSAYYSLTPMEIWFDRCIFGLRQINDGLKQPYPSTVTGLKQSLNDFQLCAQGIDVGIVLEYSTILGFDYGEPVVNLVLVIPGFNQTTSRYEGMLMIDDDMQQQTVIGFKGDHQGTTIISSMVHRADALSPLNTRNHSTTENTSKALTAPTSMQLYIGKDTKKKVEVTDVTDITIQNEMGEPILQKICKFELTQKLVKLPSTNGLRIRLLFNYIADSNNTQTQPLTIERELNTSSIINAQVKIAAENPMVYGF